MKNTTTFLSNLDFRIGTILRAEVFAQAKKPAYKLWIDFGELGIKKTSAQITSLYTTEALIGKQMVAIVNFPKKQIAHFMSECLVLGALTESGVVLLHSETKVENGKTIVFR